jgi:hypothetical protein
VTRESEDDAGRVARVLREDWLENRLVPRLFGAAGRIREDEEIELPFSFRQPVATALLLDRWNDHLWRELGRELAIGETREFLDALGRQCESRERGGPLASQVSGILDELQPMPGCAAIFAPHFAQVRELGVARQVNVREDPRSLGSPWYRGAYEDARVFSVPMRPPARALWGVDFCRLGWWRTASDVDRLDVRVGPAQGGTGREITAEEWFDVQIAEPTAAVGLLLVPDPEGGEAG